jgi:glycine cleavage system pyridoxal-binding protein P
MPIPEHSRHKRGLSNVEITRSTLIASLYDHASALAETVTSRERGSRMRRLAIYFRYRARRAVVDLDQRRKP